MEKMNDLKDLLKHEIQDLKSAEEQIIDALPKMIEKANNPTLKKALEEHLEITETHKSRCEEVLEMLSEKNETKQEGGILSRLFGGETVCKGMQGLIKEGEKIINAEMNPQVVDAAIIACAQKIEHYEICGYGTLRAYAEELNLPEISQILESTLNDEYDADDLLTSLAYGGLNQEAENGNDTAEVGSERGARSTSQKKGGDTSDTKRSTSSNTSESVSRKMRTGSNARGKKQKSSK